MPIYIGYICFAVKIFWIRGIYNKHKLMFCLIQVRDLYCNDKDARLISQRFLKNLRDENKLRPEVWAECRENPVCYGVSLGVRHFVRPLYLYTKLRQLRPNVKSDQLEGVIAFPIKEDDLGKQHCITCQRFFGFISPPIIGNCAEYDVIGNVHPNLLRTEQGQQFKAACQQHFNAFKAMMRDIHIYNNVLPEGVLRRYFSYTRSPNRPKVLKYQWNPELIAADIDDPQT